MDDDIQEAFYDITMYQISLLLKICLSAKVKHRLTDHGRVCEPHFEKETKNPGAQHKYHGVKSYWS